MGLLASWFGRRSVNDGRYSSSRESEVLNAPQASLRTEADSSSVLVTRKSYAQRPKSIPAQTSTIASTAANGHQIEDRKAQRRSRFLPSRSKTDNDLKKRRSVFGGYVLSKEQAPGLPEQPITRNERNGPLKPPRDSTIAPGTAVTADEPIDAAQVVNTQAAANRKSKRLSLGQALRRQSNPAKSLAAKGRRRSIFGGVADDEDDSPAVPSVPVTFFRPSLVHGQKIPAIPNSGLKRSTSAIRRSQRWSMFSSSGPQQESYVSTVPPVPALVNDGSASPDSLRTLQLRTVSSYSLFPTSTATEAPQPRTYQPTSAAKGFLRTTTADPESARRSIRQSLLVDDGGEGMTFFNPEQQREWAKLKHLMEVMEKRQDADVTVNVDGDAQKYSNAQALAALEFGVAH